VELGFPLETARQEGQRCYGCSAEMCVGCGVCVDACPDACIYLESKPNPEGFESALTYSIDLSRCCYCGLCTEACPTKSLVMTANFEFSVYYKTQTFLNKDRMNLGLIHSEKARKDSGASAPLVPEPGPEPKA